MRIRISATEALFALVAIKTDYDIIHLLIVFIRHPLCRVNTDHQYHDAQLTAGSV